MNNLEVLIVHTWTETSADLAINGNRITVCIPACHHDKSTSIDKRFGTWKANISNARPGLGKPYFLKLTNEEKDDNIELSIIPQHDFIKTVLNKCVFKSLRKFTLVGPNIRTDHSQLDKTPDGMKLELVSHGTLRISSHPLQIKNISATLYPKEANSNDIFVEAGAKVKCAQFEACAGDGNVFVNGMVTCDESRDEEKSLKVTINGGHLHVGVDGVLGERINENASSKNAMDSLEVEITDGNLTNLGTISTKGNLVLKCANIGP